MNLEEQNQIFRNALRAYQDGDFADAVQALRRLLKEGSTNPRHVSYCGLLVAICEGEVQDGLVLCELALREAPNDSHAYSNLAKVLVLAERHEEAVNVLRKGLRSLPRDPKLRGELQQMSPRSRPAIGFLHRDNPLNKYLGKTRARLRRQA